MSELDSNAQRITIAGGGIAALEAVLALRDLLGDVPLELIAPRTDTQYRPLSVLEPFALGEMPRFDLGRFVEEQRASWRRDTLVGVEPTERRLILGSGERLGYELLLVAVGATAVEAIPGALTFRGVDDQRRLGLLVEEYAQGDLTRIAFALPGGATWSLPLYELALMMHTSLAARGVEGVQLAIVTPEARPLNLFGDAATDAVAELLRTAGIELHTGVVPKRVEAGGLLTSEGKVETDRVVALPQLLGPRLHGLPSDEHGFIPTDRHGLVEGLSEVYAAGDATTFPIKQGGLATQEADAAAEAIAARLGAELEPQAFRPVLRGLLMTGMVARYLEGTPGEAAGKAQPALWSPTSKVFGRYLLRHFGGAEPGEGLVPEPEQAVEVEADLASAR